MTLGKRLKKEREKRGWSQLYVSEKLGITNTVLSNYERDYRDPDTDTLKNLADLYECSVDYLLGRVDYPHLYASTKDAQLAVKEKGIDYTGLTEEDIEWFDNFIQEYKKKKNN